MYFCCVTKMNMKSSPAPIAGDGVRKKWILCQKTKSSYQKKKKQRKQKQEQTEYVSFFRKNKFDR